MAPRGHTVNGLRVAQARLALPGSPSQAEFARRVGIHWVTQSNIENGKAKVSLELLERIAAETSETRDHFLGVDDEDEEAAQMPTHHEMLAALAVALAPFHPSRDKVAG